MITPTIPLPHRYKYHQDLIASNNGLGMKHKRALAKMFAQSFGLKKIPWSFALQNLEDAGRQLTDDRLSFFDHVSPFRDIITKELFVVTQPYCYHDDKSEMVQLLEKTGCVVYNLNEWAWHYPGRAQCYGIRLTPGIIDQMLLDVADKNIRICQDMRAKS